MTSPRRPLLLPFVPLYSAIVRSKRWLYDHGSLSQRHLHHPVISIGSLSAGGAGKTPVVLMLAELLAQRSLAVKILTRGYGRAGKLTEEVNPSGDASQFGDEPLLLARRAPSARVFVGRDRFRAGILSESDEPASTNAVYLLDDGFQHQKLAREVEVLLITRQDLNDHLLPAGNLREPLRSIRRADFILLREDEADLDNQVAARLPFALPPVLTIRRRLRIPNISDLPCRPLIFSGLARPTSFVSMLAAQGVDTTATRAFPDHHRYSAADITALVHDAKHQAADGFLTTEKDAIKLAPAMLDHLQTIGPVVVASLDVQLLDETSSIDMLVARLAPRTT